MSNAAFAQDFPTGSAGQDPFFPGKPTGNNRACVRSETRCCDRYPSTGLSHLRFFAFFATQIFDKNPALTVCCSNAWAVNYGLQAPLVRHEHGGVPTFWRCAGSRHIQRPLWPPVHIAFTSPFLLDYEPSVWHPYGCSPFPSLGLLLSGNSSFTDFGRMNNLLEHYI